MAQGFKAKLAAAWAFIKRTAVRVWEYIKIARLEYIIMLSLFAVDLISKQIVNSAMDMGQTVTLIPYFLNFRNIHNYNAAFGADWMTSWLGPIGARIAYCVFAVAATVVFIIILVRHKHGHKLFRISLAMLAAGAMGNCIDRWALGYVRDFVEFVYFGLTIAGHTSFYVFNLADAFLVVGVILLIVYFIFIYKDDGTRTKKDSAHAASGGTDMPSGSDNAPDIDNNGDVSESDADSAGDAGADGDVPPADDDAASAVTESDPPDNGGEN